MKLPSTSSSSSSSTSLRGGSTTMSISDIVTPELVTETEATRNGRQIEVRFVGSLEARTKSDLTVYLDALHRAALDTHASEVVVDVRALEFMSASCLRSVLVWLSALQRSPHYGARFISDTRKHWQRRSLAGLALFAGELLVQIDLV